MIHYVLIAMIYTSAGWPHAIAMQTFVDQKVCEVVATEVRDMSKGVAKTRCVPEAAR